MKKETLLKELEELGIPIVAGKINKEDVRKVLAFPNSVIEEIVKLSSSIFKNFVTNKPTKTDSAKLKQLLVDKSDQDLLDIENLLKSKKVFWMPASVLKSIRDSA